MSEIRSGWRPGFALVKLIVVLVILCTVIGVALPVIQIARKSAARNKTMDNLSECAKAVHRAHDQHKKFPSYYGPYGDNTTPLTFHANLLPFVGEQPLYDKLVATAVVPVYLSPMDPTRTDGGAGTVNFPVNIRLFYTNGGMGTLPTGPNVIYPRMPQTFQQDGTSNTLLFATKYQHCGADGGSMWMDPNNYAPTSITAGTFGVSMALWQSAPTQAACNPSSGTAASFIVDGIQVAMCDASVRLVAGGTTVPTWQAAHTPNAGDNWSLWDDWDK